MRIGIAAFAVVIALGAYAVWLGRHDPVDFDAHHRAMLEKLSGERERAQAALDGVQSRVARLQAERSVQEERRRTADQAIASLRAGDHWWSTVWNKLFGDSAERRTREERLARLEQARTEAAAQIAELRQTPPARSGSGMGRRSTWRRWTAVWLRWNGDSSQTRHYLSLGVAAIARVRYRGARGLVPWTRGLAAPSPAGRTTGSATGNLIRRRRIRAPEAARLLGCHSPPS